MNGGQSGDSARHFTLTNEVFQIPGLDIYAQMTFIVLKGCSTESHLPDVAELSRLGRMTVKQTTKALQSLVELKILPHKLYRQLVDVFRDDRLSWTAKGLLTYCGKHPQIKFSDLLELSGDSGEDEQTIRKALKELREYGYLEDYPEWQRIAN
ncbi:hypothetical protein [Paenibacillus humicola]|uniref:hypothetical protein n=1 Tax=Paenibacillus humicola TaxID=3110540 RepID=UPI00237B7674|nr:hypothetical protein [Paenibacillus humicola]